jgi:hypothetical protein
LIEQYWYQCILYPVREFARILAIALVLAASLSAMALVGPALLLRDFPFGYLLMALAPMAVASVLIAGYPSAFLDSILDSGAAGDDPRVAISWPNIRSALTAAFIWLASLFAGPAYIAIIAFFYWLHCGDPTFLDWLILSELSIVAVGYWVLCLLALARRGRLLDLSPVHVSEAVQWLGRRTFVGAGIASVLVIVHGVWGLTAIRTLHQDFANGWLLLAACCFSGLFWLTFFFRLLGVWCHLAATQAPTPGEKPELLVLHGRQDKGREAGSFEDHRC